MACLIVFWQGLFSEALIRILLTIHLDRLTIHMVGMFFWPPVWWALLLGEGGLDTRVVVVSGPAKGTLVRLLVDQLSVGRDPGTIFAFVTRRSGAAIFPLVKQIPLFNSLTLKATTGRSSTVFPCAASF